MNIYAVEYLYVDDPAALDRHRPEHREYLRSLTPDTLVVAGAYQQVDEPGALLVFSADTAAEVEEALDADPFHLQGLIRERVIRLWNPGIGALG